MKKTLFMVVILVFVLSACGAKTETEEKSAQNILSAIDAKAKAQDFINSSLVAPGTEANISEVTEEKLYKIVVNVDGKVVDSYITQDGKSFLPQVLNIAEVQEEAGKEAVSTGETVPAREYNDEEKEEIKKFVACLAEKNFKIYGADWCGWTQKLVVDTFGGYDLVDPIYVECTKETEICSEAGIQGYPTIKLDGQDFAGDRTFFGIAEKTSCPVPNVQMNETAATDVDGGC